MNKHFVATAIATCLVLSACGGGGGGGESKSSGATIAGTGGISAGGGSSGTSAATDPISKYLGTNSTACAADVAAYDATTGATVYSTYTTLMPMKSSSTQAAMQVVVKFYDTPDCSGTERHRISRQGTNDFLRVDGTVVLGAQTVDKITQGFGGFFAGANGATITDGGLILSGPYVAGPGTFKNLSLLGADGITYSGDFSLPLDAQGYPSVLRTTPDPGKHS